MNEIVKVYKDHPVRIVEHDGEPWFVAKDVSKILGYRDAFNLCRRLDDDEKGTQKTSTPGVAQVMTVISESGLYSAILGSNKPEAKAFKRWVTHEVLPSIRKNGSYSAGSKSSTQELVEQINRKLLAGETVPPEVLNYAARIAGKPVIPSASTETPVLPFRKPGVSRTAQITMVFRSLPGIAEFLDRYTDWTPRMEFVNAFYQQYADFVCGVDRCRWWDALQRIRPLERTHGHSCQFIRFK